MKNGLSDSESNTEVDENPNPPKGIKHMEPRRSERAKVLTAKDHGSSKENPLLEEQVNITLAQFNVFISRVARPSRVLGTPLMRQKKRNRVPLTTERNR
jgi:hypothetical protein